MSAKWTIGAGVLAFGVAILLFFWKLREAPVSVGRIVGQAFARRDRGDWEGFIAVLEQVPADASEKPLALAYQAQAYWELNRGLECERKAAQALAFERNWQYPSLATAATWAMLVDHYFGQERFEEVREILWKLHEAYLRRGEPRHDSLLLLLRIEYEEVDPTLAVERTSKFVDNGPRDFESRRAHGVYLTRLGRFDEARPFLEEAAKQRPDEPRFQLAWYELLQLSGKLDELGQALADAPRSVRLRPEYWILLGRSRESQRDWAGAAAAYQQAIEIEPLLSKANSLLAQALRRAGRKEEFDRQQLKAKKLSDAWAALSKIYAFHRIGLRRPKRATQLQISELCQTLGWERQAEAWRDLP